MSWEVIHGDCLEVMRGMPDNSVDAVVTDPPYGLSFMGKKWDYDVPGVEVWAECLRVLKPGGHLLAFAGTRTQHRMAVRIEDAGFEIRDMIAWVYGSGFPKSLDVSKAIDKAGGTATPPGFAAWLRVERERQGITAKELCERGGFYKNVNHGGLVSNWEAGIGFPNATQFNLLCDLLGLPFERREEVEREVLGWRKVAPGVAFSSDGPTELEVTTPATDAARQWQGWGTALKPALEPITVARKPLVGTVAENVLEHGTGALNIDGCRVAADWANDPSMRGVGYGFTNQGYSIDSPVKFKEESNEWRPTQCRWPANLIHDGSDEVVSCFPETKGGTAVRRNSGGNTFGGDNPKPPMDDMGYGDTGSAARFFYCAKASKADRDEGLEGFEERPSTSLGDFAGTEFNAPKGAHNTRRNHHPTVKPTALMRYLVRLVTPPGGTVLDPFTGSGSTGKGAKLEGFNFIGIEREAEYVEIARARIAFSEPELNDKQLNLFES